MSIMQLEEPLALSTESEVRMIELIPPVHRRDYKMGLEHVGLVIGDSVDEFSVKHRTALTCQHGRQYEGFSHVES